MTLGGQYKHKYDNNPPVGGYDPDRANSIVKTKTPSAVIKKPTHPYKRPVDQNPDPGAYEPVSNLPFGSKKSMTIGQRIYRKDEENTNPPVGGYEIDTN